MPPTKAAIRAHKLHELKKKAVAYYQANGVPEEMEKVLNDMFFDQPDDVFGYLTNFFRNNAKPARICRITGSQKCDSRGVPALEVCLFCTYKNREELFSRLLWPTEVLTYEHSRAEEKEEEEEERKAFLENAVSLLNEGFCQKLASEKRGCENVRDIDEFLLAELTKLEEEAKTAREEDGAQSGEEDKGKETPKETGSRKGKSPKGGKKGGKEIVIIPDEPREELYPGCSVLGALSMATCLAGAKTLDLAPYEYIRNVCSSEDGRYILPVPMATLIYGGKASAGKSNCVKEYMIAPKSHIPLDTVLNDFSKVYRLLAKTLSLKAGPTTSLSTDIGALNGISERPEQALDTILDVLGQLELRENYNLLLNLAGHEIFDYEKGKYEVITGQQKTADDLVEFYSDLLNKYPQIIGIIDPMRKQETEAWMKLAERVSERCLIIGDRVFHRPGRAAKEELSPNFQTSGWISRLERRNSVSDIIDCAKKMRDNGRKLVLASGVSDSSDSFMVDVAVGCQFDFLKIGAPVRGERVGKYSRLLDIWKELKSRGAIIQETEDIGIDFPKLEAPAPPSPDPEAAEQSEVPGKGSPKKK